MACDQCDKCRAMGYKFCIKCGESFADTAQVPDYSVDDGGLLGDGFLNKTVIPSMIVILISIIIDVALVIGDFIPTFDFLSTYSTSTYIFLPVYIKLATLTGTWIQAEWVFIAIVLIASAVLILCKSKPVFTSIGNGYAEATKKTPLFWISMMLGSTLILELIITLLAGALGADTKVPSGLIDLTLEESLFEFGEAAVCEELAFRFFWIGIPMAIVALVCKKKDFYKCLVGGFGMSKVAFVFLIISSVIFAYAHVSGWGLWKMFPVMLGGFAMGYLFIRFGLYASIMFHMVNDYLAVWTSVSTAVALPLELCILLFGLVCIPILFKKTIKGAKNLNGLPMTGFEDQEESNDSSTD